MRILYTIAYLVLVTRTGDVPKGSVPYLYTQVSKWGTDPFAISPVGRLK